MTGPVKSKTFTFGGVSLNASEVKSKKVLGLEGGDTRYIVDFKNGAKISYKKSDRGMVSALQFKDDSNVENYITVEGVNGLEVVGSKNKDIITIDHSTVINVDVSNDNRTDHVGIRNSKGNLARRALEPSHEKAGFGDIQVDAHDTVNVKNSPRISKRK